MTKLDLNNKNRENIYFLFYRESNDKNKKWL